MHLPRPTGAAYLAARYKIKGGHMAIEAFYSRSETDVVTFGFRTIDFSTSLVDKYNLENYDYARIGVDYELHRIYFSFQKEQAPGLSKFYPQTGRSKRRMISAGKLYSAYDWIGVLKDEKNIEKKQFVLEEVDPNNEEIYPKYKFFVTLGYSWSGERDFHDEEQYPEEPGVYRLKKEGEIVRIGESNNIQKRLKDHLATYGEQVDTFDFEIVPDEDERHREQQHLLEQYFAVSF